MASRRAEGYLAASERERPSARAELAALLAERDLPALEGALAIEERYGGLRAGDLSFGPLGLLRRMGASTAKAARSLPDGTPVLIAALSSPDEIAWFADHAGRVFVTDGGPLSLAADSPDLWIEKLALAADALAAPRAVAIEIRAALGPALCKELALGPVAEASDSASAFWKGADLVAEVPAAGAPVTLRCASVRAAAKALDVLAAPDLTVPIRVRAARPPMATALAGDPPVPPKVTLPCAQVFEGESGVVFTGKLAGRTSIEQVTAQPGLTVWETFSDGGHARREKRPRR
jgi:hypothetical protein